MEIIADEKLHFCIILNSQISLQDCAIWFMVRHIDISSDSASKMCYLLHRPVLREYISPFSNIASQIQMVPQRYLNSEKSHKGILESHINIPHRVTGSAENS